MTVGTNSLDGFAHVQPHLDAVLSVFGQRDGQPGHTVVAVPKDLDSHALVFLQETTMTRGETWLFAW